MDKDIRENILKKHPELLEQFEKSEQISEEINRAIYDFNIAIHKPGANGDLCRLDLISKQHEIENKYKTNLSYRFLYPECIGLTEENYPTYESWKNMGRSKEAETYFDIKNNKFLIP